MKNIIFPLWFAGLMVIGVHSQAAQLSEDMFLDSNVQIVSDYRAHGLSQGATDPAL